LAEVDLEHGKCTRAEFEQRLLKIQYDNATADLPEDLSEEEKAHRVAEIEYGLQTHQLQMDLQNGKITKEEYDRRMFVLMPDSTEKQVEAVNQLFKNGRINATERDKRIADIRGEPFVAVINSNYHPDRGPDGFSYELDWNTHFIEMLRRAGYQAIDENEVIRLWQTALFAEALREEGVLQDLGEFEDIQDSGGVAPPALVPQDVPFGSDLGIGMPGSPVVKRGRGRPRKNPL